VSGSTLTWVGPGSQASGTCDEDGRFSIEITRTWNVRDPDPWSGDPGCDMMEVERLSGTLVLDEQERDGGATERAVQSLDGRHELYDAAQSGTSCPELIGVQSGQVLALPCQVAYELTGTPAD
jgi:hypothetical protein